MTDWPGRQICHTRAEASGDQQAAGSCIFWTRGQAVRLRFSGGRCSLKEPRLPPIGTTVHMSGGLNDGTSAIGTLIAIHSYGGGCFEKMSWKPSIEKIGIGAMLIALGGFALVRVLRIDLSPGKKVVITYDSNLRDKIAKSRAEVPDTPPQYIEVSNELRTVRDDLDRGEVQRSLETLRDAERPDKGIPSDSDLANGMRLAEQAVKNGNPERARSILNGLLDEMAAPGSDN